MEARKATGSAVGAKKLSCHLSVLLWEVARGLDPSVPHLLEIEPVFDDAKPQELKLESICVAGGKATVVSAP